MTNPRLQPLSENDSLILFGAPTGELKTLSSSTDAAQLWNRTLVDSGIAAQIRDKFGVLVEDFPEDKVVPQIFPDSMRVGPINVGLDLAAAITGAFADAKAADERFEKATDRWKKVPDRVQGYVPGDAGSVRWTMLTRRLMAETNWDLLDGDEVRERINHVIGAAWAYMATPHFIPAELALDVVTGEPPEPGAAGEMRLPARYAMVFHDGIPVPIVAGSDEQINGYDGIITDETLVIGGILAADDVHRPCGRGFIILAKRGDDGLYNWQPILVPLGAHAAGRILYSYAALLAWEGWTAPPKTPVPRSANQVKKLARTEEGRLGAYHGVRVLDYRPPTARELTEARTEEPGQGRQMRYQTTRRAHWTKRTRIGIRDEYGQMVGRVYGPDAVEGVTFERRRVWVRRADVRPDLPERPENAVYRLPADAERL